MKNMNQLNRLLANSRGFSLLEVLLGITVFMIGMLGVTALNISSLKSNTYSGNLSEATLVAASKLEEMMVKPFDPVPYAPSCEKYKGGPEVDDNIVVPFPVAHWSLSHADWHTRYENCFDLSDRDDDGNRVTERDANDDGADDGGGNFGLDDFGADADYADPPFVKNNVTYNVYWNVAENEPVSVNPQRIKRITVIVEWLVKDKPRRISLSTIRQKE